MTAIDRVGVFQRESRRVNQAGINLSQPATIGSKLVSATMTEYCAINATPNTRMVARPSINPQFVPHAVAPPLNAAASNCGTGPVRSTFASANIRQHRSRHQDVDHRDNRSGNLRRHMMVLPGFLVSPANTATCSRPLSALKAIFVNRFMLKSVKAGIAKLSDAYEITCGCTAEAWDGRKRAPSQGL